MANTERSFLKKKTIVVIGEINEKKVLYIQNSLAELYLSGSPDILVIISSKGGSVDCGLSIYDLLTLYPGKKTAVVTGEASSMASVILQACDKRFGTANASILVHNIRRRLTLDDLRDKRRLGEIIEDMEKVQNKIYDIVTKKSGKNLEQIKEKYEKDEPMTVEEAISFGFLDGVWDKPLPK